MPYVNDGDVLDAIADALHQESANLSPEWAGIVTAANIAAEADIASVLMGRGYTAAQIAAWAHARAFNLDQATFRALTRGTNIEAGLSLETVMTLDRREDLKTLTLVIDGIAVKPGSAATGAAGGFIAETGYRITSETIL